MQCITVELSPKETWILSIIASIRCLTLQIVPATKRRDKLTSNWEGVKAEYAFSKHYNVYWNLVGHMENGSSDFVIKGKGYDIKSSPYEACNLIVDKDKVNSDYYVQAYVNGNLVHFKGWASADDLHTYKIGDVIYYGCEANQLNILDE